MNAFEENDAKKAKTAGSEEADESMFTADPGKPSPGQLTADKASCSLYLKYLTSSVHCILLTWLLALRCILVRAAG